MPAREARDPARRTRPRNSGVKPRASMLEVEHGRVGRRRCLCITQQPVIAAYLNSKVDIKVLICEQDMAMQKVSVNYMIHFDSCILAVPAVSRDRCEIVLHAEDSNSA